MDEVERLARDIAEDHPSCNIQIQAEHTGITKGDFRRLQAEVAILDPSIRLEYLPR